jgi:hypothetical protein
VARHRPQREFLQRQGPDGRSLRAQLVCLVGPRDPGPHHEERRAERELSNKEKVLKSLDVGVLGAGCVALVTGACLAHIRHQVTRINKDDERIAGLTEGRILRGWCSRRMCSS